MISDAGNLFQVYVVHLYGFLGKKTAYLSSLPISYSDYLFDFMVLSCMSSLCGLVISPLLDISLANIFSHSKVESQTKAGGLAGTAVSPQV